MTAREFDPLRLDVEAFAKAGAKLAGEWPLAQLHRLAESTMAPNAAQTVSWQAHGERREVRGAQTQIWLHLEVKASANLECQRCLGPVLTELAVQTDFLFVHGEDTAAELDAESEHEVLALTRALDLRALIEDELLLALPLVPRHGVCPEPLVAPATDVPVAEEGDAPHPFAALGALKRGNLPN